MPGGGLHLESGLWATGDPIRFCGIVQSMPFATRESILSLMGRTKYDQVFDFDGDLRVASATDLQRVDNAAQDADHETRSILIGKGWNHEQVKLLESDQVIVRAASTIAAHMGAVLKPELVDQNGNSYYSQAVEQARKVLTAFATTERRSVAEPIAGMNANVVGSERIALVPKMYVTPTKDRPNGPGGF